MHLDGKLQSLGAGASVWKCYDGGLVFFLEDTRMRMLGFSGETHGPKLAELPIWSFCWIQTFNKKHADESICRILSGHCQPSIRPVLFPNTICEFKEITGLSYMSDTPMAQNQVPPPKKNMILYIGVMILYIIYRCLSSFPPFKLKFVVYPQGPHSNPCGHQVACQPLWRCEGTISAWGRDSCASAAQGDR